jgi:hypothetical protein
MGKNYAVLIAALLILISQSVCGQSHLIQFSDVQPRLESLLAKLAHNTEQFEDIQKRMDESARANQNYNEQKNIFLSSMLAITTITAICNYEADLLTLFIDLREKNRQKFYDVRIESLQTSVKQIENMYKQIQINYTILPPNFFELPLVYKERKTIQTSIDLLNQCIDLLKSVQKK